jgi:site-specific DNA-cytosine methylase
MKKLNVMSLFNGMSFGMMALETLGVEVGNYYSSEIDKYANQATKALYPEIIQMGDVTKWREWDIDWSSIDLIIGGSPCQGFSVAGKKLNLNDHRSKLFFVYKEILDHVSDVNHKVKFMLENVKIRKDIKAIIDETMGTNGRLIDSGLVSPQDRERFYWSNIDFMAPSGKRLFIKDIIRDDNLVNITKNINGAEGRLSKIKIKKNIRTVNQKHSTLLASGLRPSSTGGCHFLIDGEWFKFSPRGAAMLQTVPEHHIETLLIAGISNTQLYKMLGNGWTHDVIVHIFKGLL